MSNNFIDWTRSADLINTSHRYTSQELLIRGGMILCTFVSGALGVYLSDREHSTCSETAMVAAGSTLAGLIASHTLVLIPLISKRCKVSNECKKLVEEIRDILDKTDATDEVKQSTEFEINKILSSVQSKNDRANASKTWGARKRELQDLKGKLSDSSSLSFKKKQ